MSDDEMVLLVQVETQVELGGIKSLLEGHGINHVVQGSPEANPSLFGGTIDPIFAPRILVAKKDLEEATALLEAKPDDGVVEGNVCAVHEKPATAACSKCNAFLCADCNGGTPPLCEDCRAAPPEAKSKTGVGMPVELTLAAAVIGVVALLIYFLGRVAD